MAWDLASKIYHSLEGHSDDVNCLAFFTDSCKLISGSDDKTVKVWNIHDTTHQTLQGHSHGVQGVAISPDQNLIASASQDGTVKIWDKRVKQGEWVITHTTSRSLKALDCCMEGVVGLSPLNEKLLIQLGAKCK